MKLPVDSTMDYPDDVRLLAMHAPALAAELAAFRGLGSVLAWMQRRGLALADVDVVQQDEFNLDFVIPLGPGGEHLAFGIT